MTGRSDREPIKIRPHPFRAFMAVLIIVQGLIQLAAAPSLWGYIGSTVLVASGVILLSWWATTGIDVHADRVVLLFPRSTRSISRNAFRVAHHRFMPRLRIPADGTMTGLPVHADRDVIHQAMSIAAAGGQAEHRRRFRAPWEADYRHGPIETAFRNFLRRTPIGARV